MLHFSPLLAQAPAITSVTPATNTVEQYGKYELRVDLNAVYSNPYNYDEVRLSAVFTGPDGRSFEVDGFFMQDFQYSSLQTGSINPLNNGVFKIRFSPDQAGLWRYALSLATPAGTGVFPEQTFTATPAAHPANKGFVRSSDSRYLQFDNREQYLPIGENIGWQGGNPYLDYKKWLDKLSANGGNFFRLWQAHWGLGIEWQNNNNGFQGLRRYKQSNGFYTDWLLDYCADKGIYVMLCLQHHGQVSSRVNPNWSESPYNAVNGGPAQNTWDFFTNATAKNHVKNRLRYILARWGYSRNIMAWELFNEVDWTDQFDQRKGDVSAWHDEMASFLKLNDPYQHLVTTSYAHDYNDPNTWLNPEMDFTQTHYYLNIPNLERALVGGIRRYLQEFQKPTLNGEFGLGDSGSGLSALDPDGIHIHNALWGALFGGSMGSAMSWWWDNYIEPRNLYYHFAPLSEIAQAIPFKEERFQPAQTSVSGAPSDLQLSPSLGWGALADTSLSIQGGALAPAGAVLSTFLYGSQWNTQFRRPPAFKVNYPKNGQFTVKTGAQTGANPRIVIWLDGVKKLEQNALINQNYTIEVPAGPHIIRIDNSGTDWISVAAYLFSGLGSAVDAYALVSEAGTQAAGWVLNNRYNHEFVKTSGMPPAASGSVLRIAEMKDGSYLVRWFDCLSGAEVSSSFAIASKGQLELLLPDILWDLAFRIEDQTVAVARQKQALPVNIFPNPLSGGPLNAHFELPEAATLSVNLLDASGKPLQTLFQGDLPAGAHQLQPKIDSGRLPAGLYWLQIDSGRRTATRPLLIQP